MRFTHRLVPVVVTSFLAACSGNDAPPAGSTGPHNDSTLIVSLSAQTDTVPEATTKQLTARVTDQTGFLKAVPLSWSSTDPSIATVSNGLVTGMSQGTTSIIASTTGGADTAQIVVTENGVVLDVQPSAAAVAMGDTVDFVATLRSRNGDIIQVNDFTWSTSDTSAATFVGAGVLHTKKEGELSVSAGALARQGNSTIRVFRSPVASVTISPSTANVYKGEKTALTVTLRDQNGRLVEGEVTWGSSDFSKATVDQNGNVTGVAGGTVVITATSERKTGSATVNVLTPPAVAVALTLESNSLVVGGEVQATATPTDASGDALSGKTIGWQSSNPSVTTVSSTGKVKGVAAGNSTISAIVDGIVARQAVSVSGATATSISISPNAPNVLVGQQSQLTARVLDQNGSVMTGQSITWSSSAPTVASVSASGLLQGISIGTTSITATSGQLSATASASVTNVAVASVRVNPTSLSLTAGSTGSVSAQALDANGNVLNGRVVTWSSANPTVATVSNAGVATAIASGSTTLTATVEGKSAGVATSVNPTPVAPVANITVSLASPSLSVGQTTQATATLKDASNNTLTGRVLSWYSLDTTVAKVSS